MTSTFNLGEKYEQLLDSLVASGDYSNKSEAMRAALLLLERDRLQWSNILAQHRAAQVEDTTAVPREQAFARIQSRFTKGKPYGPAKTKTD